MLRVCVGGRLAGVGTTRRLVPSDQPYGHACLAMVFLTFFAATMRLLATVAGAMMAARILCDDNSFLVSRYFYKKSHNTRRTKSERVILSR
jgi:hypothetical protein